MSSVLRTFSELLGTMHDFERLGAFYLGRLYDLHAKQPRPDLLLYDSKDLTTHAVCVGMTGSGKTGLCLALLEEAAIDGIPAIAIDPKGDLGNLLLTFPQLRPADFRPWVDPAEATRQEITEDQLAEQTATKWRDGLAAWGEDGARIERLRQAADVAIYTPGSNAGLPLAALKSFDAPSAAVAADSEALRERVAASVSGLLALMGIDADPVQSREHILLSNLLDAAWREGRSLDMGGLIRGIQSPPFEKVGFLDLESFFPAQDRFDLARRLNNLVSSPGFSAWMEGAPLDIQRLLYTAEGKPRLAIVSIAHLSDPERMFFVTLLLNEVVAWMRNQPGTSSLRAVLYMDEVFGYFPPIANPPSKQPMLTLLKQARAFGLGVVLATQNPVDLDYKGLSNAGTWFLGRLQTERDKARVLEGLEGASAAAGAAFDRQRMEAVLAGLGSRVFLMNNVHDDEPVVFQTRWTLSYLRGPLTREQIQTLMRDRKQPMSQPPPESPPTRPAATPAPVAGERPVLPPDVPEFFASVVPPLGGLESPAAAYHPSVHATARVHYVHSTSGVDQWETLSINLPIAGDDSTPGWEGAEIDIGEGPELTNTPQPGANFSSLPTALTRPKTYSSLATSLKDHLYRNRKLTLFKCAALKLTSRPGESEGDFRARAAHAAIEARDAQVEKLRARYAPKLAAIAEQIRRASQRVDREKSQATEKTFQAALSMGASVLGALFGRKLASSTNVTRAAGSVRAAGRAARERSDIGQAEATVESLQEKLAALDAEFKEQTESLRHSFSPDRLALVPLEIKPRKSDLAVTRVALVWRAGS